MAGAPSDLGAACAAEVRAALLRARAASKEKVTNLIPLTFIGILLVRLGMQGAAYTTPYPLYNMHDGLNVWQAVPLRPHQGKSGNERKLKTSAPKSAKTLK